MNRGLKPPIQTHHVASIDDKKYFTTVNFSAVRINFNQARWHFAWEVAVSQLYGVDIGGTFTDFVAFDPIGKKVRVWKTSTTPADPTEGVLTGISEGGGIDAIEILRLGATTATNAILERKGAIVAYVTTKGFRDIPFIQRGKRETHYDITWVKPKPLVKRRHCFEIDERINVDGLVQKPLDEEEVRDLAREISANPLIEALAVMLLFSYERPDHERRIREIFLQECPQKPISISYEVMPKWKEYQRASTTIADAYVKPIVSKYLGSLKARLRDEGMTGSVSVIRSNGGEMTLDAAASAPVQMLLSGPTGGVVGARAIAFATNVPKIVTLDIGGTSTDVSTVIDGKESLTTNFELEFGIPIQIPMIDIRSIGAGGGSLAWIDKGGMLQVGPKSAGALPGPACYSRGGTAATVTDANVVLGRIDPNNFLGGSMKLDAAAARKAVAAVADLVHMTPEDAALAIVRIINNNMVGALRSVLTERGLDPRDFSLMGFGGAGPVHIGDLLTEAGIPTGIVPNYPGQFSAFGFLMTDARIDLERTAQMTSYSFDMERANRVRAELAAEATAGLKAQGYEREIRLACSFEARYFGQNHELEIPIGFDRFTPETTEQMWSDFHAIHLARFDFNIPGEKIETVTLKITAFATNEHPELPRLAKAKGPVKARARRPVIFATGQLDTPVYDRDELGAGHSISGPALVEEAASVTVLPPGQVLVVDDWGNLRLAIA
jgi:N-methylhydantoinase A